MSPTFSAAGAEFLQHYARDAQIRWSLEDLAAQREFVNTRLAGCQWLDCSTASAALQLVQAVHAQTSLGTHEKYDALVLAGPIVELIEPTTLFRQAVSPLRPGGKLIGLIPCLRDNSPESEHFMRHAAAMLWPYYTAEELVEMLGENGGARRPTWLHWFRENFQATGRRRLRSEGSGLGRTALRGEAGMKTGSKAPEKFRPSRTNIFAEGPGAWRLGACLGF
ncbi:MAG: hypothetical protein DME22_22340 [Verrucomicrobia bacterium]|nr:MAG: hypothetical protein DME22_22340 [Verrucomicrobiota bacterium]